MKRRLAWIVAAGILFLLSACSLFWAPSNRPSGESLQEGPPNTANGERIYFTASSERGTRISYRGGPNFGGMMMGSYLTCASCHGPNGHGGTHMMHMQFMDAPDITYAALSSDEDEHGEAGHGSEHGGEYSLEDFRRAVIEGEHPDGDRLSQDMPRWQMSDDDLADLFAFIKALSDSQ